MMNSIRNNSGFTLSEIMLVVIIIGVIASAALPRYGNIVERFKAREGVSAILEVFASEKRYKSEMGSYTPVGTQLSSGSLDIVATGGSLPLRYFNQPVILTTLAGPGDDSVNCSGDSVWIAYITRNEGYDYSLCINEDGGVFCRGSICQEINIQSVP